MLCFVCCFRYPLNISSKANTKFILKCSMLMVYSCSSFPQDNYNLTVAKWIYCLCVEIVCISFVYFCYTSSLHLPMVLCLVSTNFTNNLYFHLHIYGIINIWWEIPLGREEGQFSLWKWFCCYLGVGLLSLQETPLGCSSRMPANLNVFRVF